MTTSKYVDIRTEEFLHVVRSVCPDPQLPTKQITEQMASEHVSITSAVGWILFWHRLCHFPFMVADSSQTLFRLFVLIPQKSARAAV